MMAPTTSGFDCSPLRLRLLLLSVALAALAVLSSECSALGYATSVGDPERRELAAAAGSGSSDSACPNVTTLAATTATAARITSGSGECRSETLASTKDGDRAALDVQSRGIEALASVPADVQLLYVTGFISFRFEWVHHDARSLPVLLQMIRWLRNNSLQSLNAVAFPKTLETL